MKNQKLSKDEFRSLQKHWYEKLSKLGFKDIETFKGGDFVLIQTAAHCYGGADEFVRESKADYFAAIARAAMDDGTFYRNEIDKHIIIRYSEGAKIKEIVEELLAKGTPRHRHSIRFIIRRYVMAWGLKHFNFTQLNIKKG